MPIGFDASTLVSLDTPNVTFRAFLDCAESPHRQTSLNLVFLEITHRVGDTSRTKAESNEGSLTVASPPL